jgi:hypothetical protein
MQDEALQEKWYAVWCLWKTTRKGAFLIWKKPRRIMKYNFMFWGKAEFPFN